MVMKHKEARRRHSVVVAAGGAAQGSVNEAELKEGSHHGERVNLDLDVCIEKRHHRCVPPLNCIVPRRSAILKKSVTVKKDEVRGRTYYLGMTFKG